MNAILAMIARNWLTSLPGGGLLAVAVPALFELVQNGATISSILQSPDLAKALAGVGLLLSKDMNVSGGTRDNAQ